MELQVELCFARALRQYHAFVVEERSEPPKMSCTADAPPLRSTTRLRPPHGTHLKHVDVDTGVEGGQFQSQVLRLPTVVHTTPDLPNLSADELKYMRKDANSSAQRCGATARLRPLGLLCDDATGGQTSGRRGRQRGHWCRRQRSDTSQRIGCDGKQRRRGAFGGARHCCVGRLRPRKHSSHARFVRVN